MAEHVFVISVAAARAGMHPQTLGGPTELSGGQPSGSNGPVLSSGLSDGSGLGRGVGLGVRVPAGDGRDEPPSVAVVVDDWSDVRLQDNRTVTSTRTGSRPD